MIKSNCVFDESNLFQKNETNSIVISIFVGEIRQCWDCCVSRISENFFLGISGNGLYMRDLDLNFFWLINQVLET